MSNQRVNIPKSHYEVILRAWSDATNTICKLLHEAEGLERRIRELETDVKAVGKRPRKPRSVKSEKNPE